MSQQFETLPDDVLFNILTYLEALDLCRISCVAKRFYQLSNDEYLWRKKLLVDNYHWNCLSSDANPEMYRSKFDGQMSSKEIYFRCCPSYQKKLEENGFQIKDVLSLVKLIFYTSIPKVALIGPGLESETSCFVKNLMVESPVNPLKIIKMFPGYAGGIGSGFTFELKNRNKTQTKRIDLSIIYSNSKTERVASSKSIDRMRYNRLFNAQSEHLKLSSQARDFFLSMDAIMYAVDTGMTQSEMWSLAETELHCIVSQGAWIRPPLVVVLALALEDVSAVRKLSCLDVVDRLQLNELNCKWTVINSTVMNMEHIDEAVSWILDNCQSK